MVRTFLAAAAALSLMVGSAAGAAACKDSKTGKFIKCPPPAAATVKTSATKVTATKTTSTKVCKVGKPCGNTCIAKDKVCHK